MFADQPKKTKVLYAVTAVIFIVGFWLRVHHYFENRSLWVDEAMLALNVIHLPMLSLFGQLEYHQIAPPAFLFLLKTLSYSYGSSEYMLRLPALLFSLTSMGLFYWLARRILNPLAASAALFAYAISPALIYYAAEVKPYGIDAALAIVMLFLTERLMTGWSPRNLYIWGAIGALSVWFSFAIIFVLATIGIVVAVLAIQNYQSDRLKVFAIGAIWLIGFALCYLVTTAGSEGVVAAMQDIYWEGKFLPLDGSLPVWLYRRLVYALDDPAGYALEGVAVIFLIAGLVVIYRKKPVWLFLLLGPFIFMLVASALRLYPVHERFLVFGLPMLYLIIGAGIAQFLAFVRGHDVPARGIVIAMLALLFLSSIWTVLGETGRVVFFEREAMKPILTYLRQNKQPEDRIYVYYGAIPAFIYYRGRFNLGDFYVNETTAQLSDTPSLFEGHGRVWIVLAHHQIAASYEKTSELIESLDDRAERIASYEGRGAAVHLFDFGNSRADQPIPLQHVSANEWVRLVPMK